MSINYFVIPGEILKEYMDERNITQKELAKRIESSEKHISEVVNGKAKITEDFAVKLVKAFPDVKAEFWLGLENEYRLFLFKNRSREDELNKEIVNKYRLNEVFKGLNYDDNRKVNELFDIAEVSDALTLEEKVSTYNNVLFKHDGGNKHTIYLWLKLCEEQIEIQNNLLNFPKFENDKLKNNLPTLKKILNTKDYILALKNTKKFLNSFGVGLVIEQAIPTAKVRGATTLYQDHPMIYLTTRYKRIDSIYFALIHEIYHIVEQDYLKDGYTLSYEEDERDILSNYNAKDFFINKDKYEQFTNKGGFSEEEIIIFAKENRVIVDIVIGRLQFEGYVEYNEHQRLRTYIEREVFYNVFSDIEK